METLVSSPNGKKKLGKGEIALFEQFLLFPQRFQKTCTADHKDQGLFAKGLKELQESMDRCTGHHHITEILLKTALNTIQSINQRYKIRIISMK